MAGQQKTFNDASISPSAPATQARHLGLLEVEGALLYRLQLTAGPSALPRDGQKLEQIHESVLLPPCHAIGLETGTAAQDYI